MSHNHVISAKTCNVIEMQKTWQVCMWCYVMHVQGITKHIWVKVCKTHTQYQNMINKSNHGNPQSLVLIGAQNNTKMSFGHFIKHSMCTYKTNMRAMHKHEWILPKYMLNFHNLPTQTHKKKKKKNQMGQSLIKKLKNFHKI